MVEKKYLNIIKHYEKCLEAHGDTYKGADWPNEHDALKRYGVMLDIINKTSKETTLLDFGCGTGHLYEYILKNQIKYSNIKYSGLDISEKLISIGKTKYPYGDFYCLDILNDDTSILKMFDYAVLNGVFTEKINLTFDEMWKYFRLIVPLVFNKINEGLAFNVMSKAVDWEREDLFHLSTDLLINFLTKDLTRNFVIRNDYGLYEYTVYIYK